MDQNQIINYDSEYTCTHNTHEKKSFIQSFLRQLKNGTPVYRVQLPIFLIEPRSLLERYSDFGVHLDYVLNLWQVTDPEQRFLQVLKFYLSGWHMHPKEVKNPFNPILGEVFRCSYNFEDSTTEYVAEQISHHPPSTAFCLYNPSKYFALNAFVKPSFKFNLKSNSLETILGGKLKGHLLSLGEEYEAIFPHIVVKGIIMGTLNMDLCGTAYLKCPQSGYVADMEFRTKGYFTGKESHVSVKVKRGSQVLYTLEGRWDGIITITSHLTNQTQVFFNALSATALQKIVPHESEQQENESRRIWKRVIQNICCNQELEAQQEKTIVEDAQRAREAERKASGEVHTPQYFTRVSDDYYIYSKLAQATCQPVLTKAASYCSVQVSKSACMPVASYAAP